MSRLQFALHALPPESIVTTAMAKDQIALNEQLDKHYGWDKAKLYIITYSDPNPNDENRQSFSAEWWSEGYHLGAQWRGQMFYSTIDDIAKQFPSKEIVIAKGERNVRYHSRRR